MDVSLEELSMLKQAKGEAFTSFFPQWKSKANRSKWTMVEEEKICTIISNLEKTLSFHLKMQCITTYDHMIPKELNIKRALIAQGGHPRIKNIKTIAH